MKKLIVYRTKYGSVKQYAEWLAEETGADLVPEKELKPAQLAEYDVLVFGGRLYAGRIQGLAKLKVALSRLKDKKILVFAVGAVPPEDNPAGELARRNFKDASVLAAPLFVLPGKLMYSQLRRVDRMMVGMVSKMFSKKPEAERSPYENALAGAKGRDLDMTDRSAVKPIAEAMQ